MKRNLLFSPAYFCLFLILIFNSSILFSQVTTRTSIANGAWNNPAIWNPVGVPMPGDDSIIINTDVTFNQNIFEGQVMFRVNAGASLIDAGNDTASFGCDRVVIKGYFSVDVFAIGTSDSATNYGSIFVTTDFAQSGTFINENSGQICVGQQLATSDDFINDGSIKTDSWANGAAVTGNLGKFCIANSFINTDAISGTIDICDATPNSFNDVNAGTIAGTVTHCANGPCGLCPVPNGIADNFSDGSVIKIFPNPFTSSTQIQIDPSLVRSGLNLILVMYDVNGKEVRNEKVSNSTIVINKENLTDGIYFYRLIFNGNAVAEGKMIAE